MDYARVDFEDSYIYLENKVLTYGYGYRYEETRARELLRERWGYQRIKRLSKLPEGKKANVWYHKRVNRE